MKPLDYLENATVNKYNGVLFIGSKLYQDNFEILKQDRIVYCPSRAHNSEGIIHIYLREKTSTAFRVFDFDVFNFYEKIKIEGGGVGFSSDSMEAYYSNSQIDEFNYREFWYKGELVWSRKEKDLSDFYPGSGLISSEFVLRKSYSDSNKMICSELLTDREIWSWNAKEYFENYKPERYQKGKLDQRIIAHKEYFLVQWTYAWGKQLKIALHRELGRIHSIFDVQFYFYELKEDYYISSSAKGKVQYNHVESGEVYKYIDVGHIKEQLGMDSFLLKHIEEDRAYFVDSRKFNIAVVDLSSRKLIKHMVVTPHLENALQINNVVEHNGKVYVEIMNSSVKSSSYITQVYEAEYID